MICPDSEHTSVCRCKDLLQLHGTPVYHCNFWHCIAFRKGYNTTFARDDHVQVHSRTARFPEIGKINDYLSPDGDSAQSESDTEVLEVSGNCQNRVLEDAICSGRFDLIRKFWPKEELDPQISKELVQLAALTVSLDMVEFIVSKSQPNLQKQRKADALAVAIETENIHSIKALLSTSSEIIHLQSAILPQFYRQIPQKRCDKFHDFIRIGLRYGYSGFHRAFSLFNPELMKVLVDECGVTVPTSLKEVGLLVRCVGFRNADPDDRSRRFEAMKPYIHENWQTKEFFEDWLRDVIIYYGPDELLNFCLENGADPNTFDCAMMRSGKALAVALLVLLRFGANPKDSSLRRRNGELKARVQRLLSECDMSWEEFVKRAKDGEPLEWFNRRRSV